MADEQIKVRFIGDDSSLAKASTDAAKSLSQAEKASQGLTNALRTQAQVSSQVVTSATNMAKGAGAAGGAVQKTSRDFTGLSRVLQDLPFGFTAISNNLTQLLPAAGAAGLAFSGIVTALTFAQVGFGAWTRGLGGIIGASKNAKIALTDLSSVFEEAGKSSGGEIVKLEVYKQKLNDLNIPASERLKILKEYNAIADKTNQIDATQIGNLQLINEKIDAQNSLIIKRALSTAALSKITEAANKLIDNEMKLQEEFSRRGFKDLADYESKTNDTKVAAGKLKSTLQELALQKMLNPQGLPEVRKGLDGVVNPAQNAATAVQQADNSFTALISSVKKGRGELQNLAKSLSGLITIDGLTTETVQDKTSKNKHAFLFDFLPFDPAGKLKPEQRAELIDAINKFQKEVGGIIKGVPFTGTQDQIIRQAFRVDADIKAGKINFNLDFVRTELIREFGKIKDEDIIPTSKLEEISAQAVDSFIRGFKNESERIKNLKLFDNIDDILTPEKALKNLKFQLARIGEQLPKTFQGTDLFGAKKIFKLEELFDFTKISPGDAIKALQNAFGLVQSEIETQLNTINNSISNFFSGAFEGVGQSIADALINNSDPIKAAVNTIFTMIGDLIQQIGKAMVQYGIVKTELDKILKAGITLPGAAAIALGASAIAIGALIKGSFKPKGFAQGGVVFGPTFGMIGEGIGTSRSNPEIVAPLDKLKDYIGQAQGGFPEYLPVVSFSYDQVRMMYKRADKQRKIFGG